MRDVLAFARRSHTESLDRFRQDNRRLAFVLGGTAISRVHLERIVPAAIQAPYFVVGHIRYHRFGLRVATEKMLANVSTALRLEVLVFTVDALFHRAAQETVMIKSEQRIPA